MSPPPDLSALLSAPAGELSLRCEQTGCFDGERLEVRLVWSPGGAVLRTPESDSTLGEEDRLTLLRRVVSAAALPVPEARIETTTTVVCSLGWSATAADHTACDGHAEWTTSEPSPDFHRRWRALRDDPERWPARLELPPHPVYKLGSIAREPLSPERPPRPILVAVLEIETRDAAAAHRPLQRALLVWGPPFEGPRRLPAGGAEGAARLQVSCDVTDLCADPAPGLPEDHPALRELERRLREDLGDLALSSSIWCRRTPW